mmetsp:Transcript_15025/g.27658  ORF Transcript_15025/g.27658 Transcript_15025/m.27658 type:complete len:199 (-) Transcript_15025:103-699(-)
MRHGRNLLKLSRPPKQRGLLLRNLTTSLCEHERIITTKAKAKAMRKMADRMVTIAKRPYLTELRRTQMLKMRLFTDKAVDKVMNDLRHRFEGINGNYCYIKPLGHRKGDGAKLAMIQYKYNPMELLENEDEDTFANHIADFNYKMLMQEQAFFQDKLKAIESGLVDPLKSRDPSLRAQEKLYKAQIARVQRELTHFST